MGVFTIRGSPADTVSACRKILEVMQQGLGSADNSEITMKLVAPAALSEDLFCLEEGVLAGISKGTKTTIDIWNDNIIKTAIDDLKVLFEDLNTLKEERMESAEYVNGSQASSDEKEDPSKGRIVAPTKPEVLRYARNQLIVMRKHLKGRKKVPISSSPVLKVQKINAVNNEKLEETRDISNATSKGKVPQSQLEPTLPKPMIPAREPLPQHGEPLEAGQKQGILRWTHNCLDKMTPDNLQALAKDFCSSDFHQHTGETLLLMRTVFHRAVGAPTRATLYAKWLHLTLVQLRITFGPAAAKTLRESITHVCREEFKAVAGGDRDAKGKTKRNKLCAALFTGAVYKLISFSPSIMTNWIHELFGFHSNGEVYADGLECLCKLLKSVGKILEVQLQGSRMLLKITKEDGQVSEMTMSGFFDVLKQLLKKILPLQTRIRLEELIEFRENNWQTRESTIVQFQSSSRIKEVKSDGKKEVVKESPKVSVSDIETTCLQESPVVIFAAPPEPRTEVEDVVKPLGDFGGLISLDNKPQAVTQQDMKKLENAFSNWESFSSSSAPSTPLSPGIWSWDNSGFLDRQPDSHQRATSPTALPMPGSIWDDNFTVKSSVSSFFSQSQPVDLQPQPRSHRQRLHSAPQLGRISELFQLHELEEESTRDAAARVFRLYFKTGDFQGACEDQIVKQFGDATRQRILLEVVVKKACESWSKAEQQCAGEFIRLMIASRRPGLGYLTHVNFIWTLANTNIMTDIESNLRHNPKPAMRLATFFAEIVRGGSTKFVAYVQLVDSLDVESCDYESAADIFKYTVEVLRNVSM